MKLKIRYSFLLVLLLSPLIYAAEGTADFTTRICFGRFHPECFLIEERNANGKKEYGLASTKRGRVAEERILMLAERNQLLAAILRGSIYLVPFKNVRFWNRAANSRLVQHNAYVSQIFSFQNSSQKLVSSSSRPL